MFDSIIDFLKRQLAYFGLNYKVYNKNIIYFQCEKLRIAFDVVHHQNLISIDFVARAGFKNVEVLKVKYPALSNNKYRLLTKPIETDPLEFFTCIKNEFLELSFMMSNELNTKVFYRDINNTLQYEEPLKFWFYDAVPNFGDFMTPWLANYFTQKPVVNVREWKFSEGAILGVGSIVQTVTPRHQKIKVWGSGLITDVNSNAVAKRLQQCNLEAIYASRGLLTRDFFEKNNFKTSKVVGDPGLLFGSIYQPKIDVKYKYAIVPHYIHYKYFLDLNLENCLIVNVKDELTKVIDQICSAEKCISSSLHGLIISQSYNIPWVHLYINDGRPLAGGEFKFHDFFSILENDISQKFINTEDINSLNIMKIFNEAYLPNFNKNYSEKALKESFFESLSDNVTSEIFSNQNILPKLVFLGDSHINYFKFGANQGLYAPFHTETCMASGATVLGLNNINSFTQASEKFKNHLKKHHKESEIFFQLGEVDCGILIWIKAEEKNISIHEQAQLTILSYKKFINDIKDLGYKNINITSATIPTINDEDHTGEIISLRRKKVKATFIERTNLTIYFNSLLKSMCSDLGVNYLDATSLFINESTSICDEKFRNKDKTDHHMEPFQASYIWSEYINQYLRGKYKIEMISQEVSCIEDSYLKTHKSHSSLLDKTNKYKISKGDKLIYNFIFNDGKYILCNNVYINGKLIWKKNCFLNLKHFSL